MAAQTKGEVLDANPTINRLLLIIRQELRAGMVSGRFGEVNIDPVIIHDGKANQKGWKCGFRQAFDLTAVGVRV